MRGCSKVTYSCSSELSATEAGSIVNVGLFLSILCGSQ